MQGLHHHGGAPDDRHIGPLQPSARPFQGPEGPAVPPPGLHRALKRQQNSQQEANQRPQNGHLQGAQGAVQPDPPVVEEHVEHGVQKRVRVRRQGGNLSAIGQEFPPDQEGQKPQKHTGQNDFTGGLFHLDAPTFSVTSAIRVFRVSVEIPARALLTSSNRGASSLRIPTQMPEKSSTKPSPSEKSTIAKSG